MPIDERTRLDLRQWFSERMTDEMADAMMEAMPPIDHQQLATHAEMAELRGDLRRDMAELRSELRGEMAELRSELRGEMAELRGDVTAQIATHSADIRAEIARSSSMTLRWVVATQFAAGGFAAALVGIGASLS